MMGRKSVWLLGAAFAGGGTALLCPAAASDADFHTFEIPAGDASKTVPDLARQAGRQVVAPGEALRALKTPAVHGAMDTASALGKLLEGTDLEIVSDDGTTIILRQRSAAREEHAPLHMPASVETITVTGYRASLAGSIGAKRSSIVFSDSVYAEDIGKFADSNVAEAFNRIPGITISREIDDSGVNVSIRGLDSNFTKVLLNGAPVAVASTGPTNNSNPNREVDLNIFPVELFTRLTVEKSPRASQIEGGASGTIDMHSARAFDNPGLHLTYVMKGTILSSQNTLGPEGAIIASNTIGPFGILAGLSGNTTRFFTPGFETAGWTTPSLRTSGPVIQCAPADSCNTLGAGNWSIPATVPANVTAGGLVPGETLDETRLLALNPGLSISQLNNMLVPRLARPFMEKGTRSRLNGILSLEYHASDALYFFLDTVAARTGNDFDRSDINWVVRNGAAIPLDVQVDADGVVTSGTFANAQWILEDRPYRERGDFISLSPGAEWQASDLLKLSLQANASRSHFFRDVPSILVATPATGAVTVAYAKGADAVPSLATNVDLNDPQSFGWSGGRVNVNAEKRYTYTTGVHFDAQYGGDVFQVAIGAAYDEAYRSILGYDNSQAWQNAVCGDNPNVFVPYPNSQPPCQGLTVAGSGAAVNAIASDYPSYPGLGTGYSSGYPALTYQGSLIPQTALVSYLKPGPRGFVVIDHARFFADSHYAQFAYPYAQPAIGTNLGVGSGWIDERNYGLYVEGNGTLSLGSRSLRYNAGLRWVETLQTVAGPVNLGDPRDTAAFPLDGGKYPNTVSYSAMKNTYGALLPSLNLVYELSDDVQLRASLSRTMTRPNPTSLLPGVNFGDQSASNATLGNASLKPYFSNNLDVGAELYTGEEGHLGFAYFRKAISGFTAAKTAQQPFSYLSQFGITYDTLNQTQKDAIDARGGPGLATVAVSEVVNASGLLTIDGLEFSYVQPLDFLFRPIGVKGLGLAANLTVVDQKGTGAAPAVATGVSPYTYNLTAYYEDNGLSLRLSYVFNDRQVQSTSNQNGVCLPNVNSKTCPEGAYINASPYAQMDLSAGLKLSRLFGALPSDPEAVFDIQNLTRSKMRSYFQYPQATYVYYAPGATIVFGLRGSF